MYYFYASFGLPLPIKQIRNWINKHMVVLHIPTYFRDFESPLNRQSLRAATSSFVVAAAIAKKCSANTNTHAPGQRRPDPSYHNDKGCGQPTRVPMPMPVSISCHPRTDFVIFSQLHTFFVREKKRVKMENYFFLYLQV